MGFAKSTISADPARVRPPGGRAAVAAALATMLVAAVAGIVLLAVPDSALTQSPDSLGYLRVAERLAALDPHALAMNRGILYPLLLALHRATGLSHHFTVSGFNLAALALLVWRLHARGPRGAAVATAALGLALLLSSVNLSYSAIYLRESVVLGVTSLHLALLTEALRGPWRLPLRLGLTAAAVLLAYELKGLYAYVFLAAGPLLVWAQLRAAGWRGTLRPAAVALAATLALVLGTWATNPLNDARQKGMTLVGVLLNSNLPAYYLDHPNRLEDPETARALGFMSSSAGAVTQAARRAGEPPPTVDPYWVERRYRERFGTSLRARAGLLFLTIAADRPLALAGFLARRTAANLRGIFLGDRPWTSVCVPHWGVARGLPASVCRPLAWTVFGLWGLVPLLLVVVALLRWDVAPGAVAAVGLLGMVAGLAVAVGALGYSDLGRLSLLSLAYGVLALPLALGLLAEAARGAAVPAPASDP